MKLKALFITVIAVIMIFCSCTVQKSEIPTGMKLFSNDLVDYTAYVPESWIIGMSTATLSAYASSTDASSVTITAHALEAEDVSISLDDYWARYEEQFKKTLSDMKYVGKTKKVTLDGKKANQYTYTATVTDIEYKYMQTVCINNDNNTVYIITYTSTPDNFDTHIDDIGSIVDNFKFK